MLNFPLNKPRTTELDVNFGLLVPIRKRTREAQTMVRSLASVVFTRVRRETGKE